MMCYIDNESSCEMTPDQPVIILTKKPRPAVIIIRCVF